MQRFRSWVITSLVVLPATLVFAQTAEQEKLDWFDGETRTFVVNGYSTSFQWPAVLQRKLDRYFEGKRVIEVKSATHGGTPIARWINIETGEPLQPWTLKLRPLLNSKAQPTIVLGQQSLQWVFGDRANGIRNDQDTVNLRKGADALQRYSDLLFADGADAVVIAMHIYKQGMEPAIGNERLALELFLKSKPANVYAGPDVWQPTSKLWPQAFQSDKVHPNAMGAEVMAHHWFKTLLTLSGREVPTWSEEEMDKAIRDPPPPAAARPQRGRGGNMADRMRRHDKNGDGKITKAEFQGPAPVFTRFDRNQDGVVDSKELETSSQ